MFLNNSHFWRWLIMVDFPPKGMVGIVESPRLFPAGGIVILAPARPAFGMIELRELTKRSVLRYIRADK
jgi:hypothetical protein